MKYCTLSLAAVFSLLLPVAAQQTPKPSESAEAPHTVPTKPETQAPEATGNTNAIISADEVRKRFALVSETDPLLKALKDWTSIDWTSETPQIFINNGNRFITADGGTAADAGPAASAYLSEYGCSHLLSKKFSRTQRAITIYIYSFPSTDGAFGAFSLMHTGSRNVYERADGSSEDENSISFWQGHRFVVIKSSADEDEVSKVFASKTADQLSAHIGEHGRRPILMNRLPVLDQVRASERFLMGPLSVRRQVALPFIPDLSIEHSLGVAFAQYQIAPPDAERMQTLIIEYGNPNVARQTYARYAGLLANSHKVIPVSASGELVKLPNGYLLVEQNESRISIVAGARRKTSPFMLSRQLAR